MDYTSKKGKLGGDKRKIGFTRGDGDKMVVKVSGLINKDATISIGPGLPNTSSNAKTISSCNSKNIYFYKVSQKKID